MRFTPKTEAQVSSGALFPKGNYDFEVVEAKDTISKSSSNNMLALQLLIYDQQGHSKRVFDYLLDTENAAYKLRHFAEAVGLLAAYATGDIKAEDCMGRTGRCKVAISKDKTEEYPDKNTITDYIYEKANGNAPTVKTPEDDDEQIPF